MLDKIRYLLLQVRNPDDPMRQHEVRAFSRALHTAEERIEVFDLLSGVPPLSLLDRVDMVLYGGSGDYSVASEGEWLTTALAGIREVVEVGKPTFASCWGFQAIARALGGKVEHRPETAELGTVPLQLTDAGAEDPVFGPLGRDFLGQMGHEDTVVELPPGAILLASSQKVANQAYCFADKPIYCTQFHPELNVEDLHIRVSAYPRYIEKICGMPIERFGELLQPTPETEALLLRFVERVFA